MRSIQISYTRTETKSPSEVNRGSKANKLNGLREILEGNRKAAGEIDKVIDRATRYRGDLESEKMRIIDRIKRIENGGG